jgi:cation diffusion facilitator CzcD-associated flavoprotein CzcO
MNAPDVDVLIVGAGISGIGAAHHLQKQCPDRSFAILEGRDDIGGTWDLFRYPGVRSDSDMHTLGFSFKPWTSPKSIADGPSILAYLREAVDEDDLARHIRFRHQGCRATWATDDARWTLEIDTPDGPQTMTGSFLFMCSGYYSYRGGHTPEFAGRNDFSGTIIHPQQWPDDFDHAGKRIVVIGSGATAVTLVPALAETAAHVTMLQRSPTWMAIRPDEDKVANGLRRVLPDALAYRITRRKNVVFQQKMYEKTRTDPDMVRERLLTMVAGELPSHIDIDEHFTPSYDPWDQRLCLVPNGDLFSALRGGRASVVTATIDRFTEGGIRLDDGDELEADVIVTATGLQMVTLGEMDFEVDGVPVDFAQTFTYKGLAYSDVPNLVSTFGYINASWTLRADLTSDYVCRLLNHLQATGTSQCTPRLRPIDANMEQRPWIEDFSSGYMQRMMPMLPKQGDRDPWTNPQNLARDRAAIRDAPIDDGVMRFT